jgi:hypothetical protein
MATSRIRYNIHPHCSLVSSTLVRGLGVEEARGLEEAEPPWADNRGG